MEKAFLEWDSDFFGKRIFKLSVDESTSLEELKQSMIDDNIDLGYIFSKEKLSTIEQEGIILVDEKTIYTKGVNKNLLNYENNIKSYTGDITDQLQKLAFLSGTYSRFKVDKSLNFKFKDLYTIWLNRSLKREIADDIFVYYNENNIVGFVTFKTNAGICVIGLIAVDERYQGLKIGTILLKEVETWCVNNNVSRIDVATQGLNKQACVFYEKAGYQVHKIEYIYHIYAE